jgi:glycosyltransferase involved in cell wall biosynthesis
VTTVHDLIYHGRSGVVPRISAWLLNRAALSSELVITGSFAARDAIVSDIGVARDRIIVIPHGTNAASVPADPWSEVAALDIARGRSILFSTGNRLPHKNFEGLLYALACIPSAERPLTVIAGGRGEDPLRPLVTRLGLEDDVVLPGWVSPTQLESLYAVADLYVCPSLLEGFGLPVIDAMRRGCIVLANDVPVLREVGGEAAFYADATKAEAFASAIRSALASDDTGRRNAGRHRSMAFTWEASAERTAETLRQAYSSSVRNAG